MTKEEAAQTIDAERRRLHHAISRMQSQLNALADAILLKKLTPGMEEGQAIVQGAMEIATILARMFAYGRV